MKLNHVTKLMTMSLCSWLCVAPALAAGDDIDIFTGASAGAATNPRILIILDNTSNWARASEGWPSGMQGDSELRAIKTVVSRMNDNISIGMMEFTTGNPKTDAGFIRQAIKPVTAAYKSSFGAMLDGIRINDSTEKGASNAGYGEIMRSAYLYFAGGNALTPGSVNQSKADSAGYINMPTKFRSPLSNSNICGKSFIVFIGNVSNGGPNSDTEENRSALHALTNDRTELSLPRSVPVDSLPVRESVGNSSGCYDTALAAEAAKQEPVIASSCSFYNRGCAIGAPVVRTPETCPAGTNSYSVIGSSVVTTIVPAAGTLSTNRSFHADEWARMLAEKGVPVSGSSTRSKVATYTIDVHNRNPDPHFTGLLLNMALHGDGKYFKATTEQAIIDALESIMAEIQADNSAFASTSLPVNATNRTQNENQVFIGMFRPDVVRRPRWFGNLKRYQLILVGGRVQLGDENGDPAINNDAGFIAPCADSYWTKDSGTYWNIPSPGEALEGTCGTDFLFSDKPDGQLVEKGAAAQVLRQGNTFPLVANSRTLNRQMKTVVTSTAGVKSLAEFNTTNVPAAVLPANIVNYIRGADVLNEKQQGASTTMTRPTIHGDVIHSRPLPVNYGAATATRSASEAGVTVFYGANDGALHAVDAATGVERWSFVAPEFFPRLRRLHDNVPLVSYSGDSLAQALVATRKDYFFDGSVGLFQNETNTQVHVYPSMRRGGRSVYALDVTTPSTPSFMWKKGCPNLAVTDDENCDAGFSEIGQTWSTPIPAFIEGFSPAGGETPVPVLVFGGGYDSCEDADAKIGTTCNAAKGRLVYVVNAKTGAIIRTFPTTRPVAADIAMVDVNDDGNVDYAYAADTGGGMYRISFAEQGTVHTNLAPAAWSIRKIGQVDAASGRKFLFAPALLHNKESVYIAITTGDREHPLEMNYPYQTNVQNRAYVFRDILTELTGTTQDFDALTDRSVAPACGAEGVGDPGGTMKGWFMNLENGRGEQGVTSPLIAGGMVTFNTNRPNPETSGTCRTALGHAHGYWLNLLTGSGAIQASGAVCGGARSSEFVAGGLPPTPVLATQVPIEESPNDDTPNIVYATVAIGAVQRDTVGANVAFSPQQVIPALTRARKRTYTNTAAD